MAASGGDTEMVMVILVMVTVTVIMNRVLQVFMGGEELSLRSGEGPRILGKDTFAM